MLYKQIGEEVRNYIDQLTKPRGSLGRLEELAIEVAKMTGERFPRVTPPGVLVFAADHGIAKEGVSAYPQEVTAQMVLNFARGGAAINVFSKQIDATFAVVDVGVAVDIHEESVINEKVAYGTNNFAYEKAMTKEDAERAVQVGYRQGNRMIDSGIRCLIVGEMGIGNTTTASALLAAMSGRHVAELVGKGTGIHNEAVKHKRAVIERALMLHQPKASDPIDLLTKIGGLEIAAMAGAMIAAAERRIPILLDGFICTVAALVATRFDEDVVHYMIASHESVEPGHRIALQLLNKEPLVRLHMRLGEGSGAAVAFPIVNMAMAMLRMATFSSGNVSTGSDHHE
ncbi:nicotinate-nucleotide--dimethylbenzimidazole phosphoribosyltransferase [Anoxybacillus suryakundensis]|uniref:Nicotinate-nucleotide--dimethylbenzimidazole phosphoribosyltransferase n=1 Tax=Anoxybacillus suryakundensis TaxID=1325335 RepID=A0A0K6GLF2_9BACL|nr:nicotinate-nucleotide--dimethylbenzimidazole phosphoribosyltransferase [Anoxybacillus suryakundensis]CUA79336.1 nicotinate-nucleotide-dimethylbenzimidazole phosphoribosyltransferase [Anoxybacillus suryakundensis]